MGAIFIGVGGISSSVIGPDSIVVGGVGVQACVWIGGDIRPYSCNLTVGSSCSLALYLKPVLVVGIVIPAQVYLAEGHRRSAQIDGGIGGRRCWCRSGNYSGCR